MIIQEELQRNSESTYPSLSDLTYPEITWRNPHIPLNDKSRVETYENTKIQSYVQNHW